MKEFLLTATYIVGAGELFLAWYFWKTNSGNEIRKVMALLTLSIGAWVISSAMTAYTAYYSQIPFFIDIIYFFGILLITLLFHFTIIFPYPLFRIDLFHRIGIYLPVALFSIIIFFSDTIVKGFIVGPSIAGDVEGGPLFGLYNLYLFVLFIISMIILALRIRKTGGIFRRMSKIAFWSILGGGLPAVIIDLVIATFSPKTHLNALVANLLTATWLGITSFVVLRKS